MTVGNAMPTTDKQNAPINDISISKFGMVAAKNTGNRDRLRLKGPPRVWLEPAYTLTRDEYYGGAQHRPRVRIVLELLQTAVPHHAPHDVERDEIGKGVVHVDGQRQAGQQDFRESTNENPLDAS